MASKALPSLEVIRQLLRYDPETGKFMWAEKQVHMIASDRESTRQRIARNWNARYAGLPAFTSVSVRGYHDGVVCCIRLYAHRVAWAMHYGEWPHGEIDHINGDPLDNRISNLRVATRTEQMRNQPISARNQTGAVGVWWDAARKRYQAYIRADGRRISLGRFTCIDDAKRARAEAERLYGFHANHGRARVQSSKM